MGGDITPIFIYLFYLYLLSLHVIGGRKGEIETNRKGRKKR